MSLTQLPIDVLAALRITRLVTQDTLPPLKRAREHAQSALPAEWAEGVTCTWCVGVWAAAATQLLPRRLRYILAVAHLVGVGMAAVEHLESVESQL